MDTLVCKGFSSSPKCLKEFRFFELYFDLPRTSVDTFLRLWGWWEPRNLAVQPPFWEISCEEWEIFPYQLVIDINTVDGSEFWLWPCTSKNHSEKIEKFRRTKGKRTDVEIGLRDWWRTITFRMITWAMKKGPWLFMVYVGDDKLPSYIGIIS